MKLEYLYPELGNLFGDGANLRYLARCLPQAEITETRRGDVPAFVSDPEVAFLYAGPMTERCQRIALEALRPYAAALRDRLEGGLHALFTGNAMELPGRVIHTDEGDLEGLGLLELGSRRTITRRYNGFFLGDADGIEITAFNSRFSRTTPGTDVQGFARVVRGIGLEEGCAFEGYRFHNLVGTYLLGPLLVLNPLLTQRLLQSMGFAEEPACFAEAMEAYRARLAEFKDKRRKLD